MKINLIQINYLYQKKALFMENQVSRFKDIDI